MKKFDKIKTLQLIILVTLTVTALTAILRNKNIYTLIATDPSAKIIAIVLWLTLGLSFLFLLYDFNSYADMRRENIELDNAIYQDALTGIANRYSVDMYIGQFMKKPLTPDIAAVTIDITNLAEINAAHGHSGGDVAIQAFSEILQNAANGVCFIGRNGGNKFVAIFRECTQSRIDKFIAAVRDNVDARNAEHADARLEYSIGVASAERDKDAHDLAELVALSDHRAMK